MIAVSDISRAAVGLALATAHATNYQGSAN